MAEKEDVFDVEEEEIVMEEDTEQVEDSEGEEDTEQTGTEVVEQEPQTNELAGNDNPLADIGYSKKDKNSTIQFGQKVSRYPVEKMRFSKNSKELISILRPKPVMKKLHYHEDVGSFFCFEGACCEHLDLPRVRYIFPTIVYDTNKKGKPISTNVELKAWQVSDETYESIISISEMNGPVDTFDILVTCTDEQFQKVNLTYAKKAKWRTKEKLVNYVRKLWKKNRDYLTADIAREITEEQFIQDLDLNRVSQADDSMDVDFDGAFED